MNYLQLAQRVNRESGTASGDSSPSTVVSQTGRLLKICDMTATAYQELQSAYADWLWLRAQFSGNTTANTSRYTPASFNLTRHSRWITTPRTTTIYLTATGVSDEGNLDYLTYDQWRQLYDWGTQTPNRPRHYAVSPTQEFCLGPVPDATYTVRGEYQKSAQVLAANADIPEMPADYHMLIVWNALLHLSEFDEGGAPQMRAQRLRSDLWRQLTREQRPTITYLGTLA